MGVELGLKSAALGLIIRKRKQFGETGKFKPGNSDSVELSSAGVDIAAEDVVALLRHFRGVQAMDDEVMHNVPLSYGSVDVAEEKNCLLRHKAGDGMPQENRILYGIITRSDVDLRRLVSFDVFRKARGVERLHECNVRISSNGTVLEVSVIALLRNGHVEVYGYAFWVNQCTSDFHRINEPDDRGVTEGREDVREVFQQRRSGAKRKLSKCGRNQMGNELILALPEGADDFVVYYDARSKDLEAGLEKGEDFVILCVLYVFGVGYVILDNQSIERDRLNGIGFVLNFVKFISFTFGDKEMILVIEAVSR
ncbi:hypothetical protein Tco_1394424 [Tanacetum coccineum]